MSFYYVNIFSFYSKIKVLPRKHYNPSDWQCNELSFPYMSYSMFYMFALQFMSLSIFQWLLKNIHSQISDTHTMLWNSSAKLNDKSVTHWITEAFVEIISEI